MNADRPLPTLVARSSTRSTLFALLACSSLLFAISSCDAPSGGPPGAAPSASIQAGSVMPAVVSSASLSASAAPVVLASAAPSASPHTEENVSAPATPTPNVALPNEKEGPCVVAWRPNGRAFAAGLGKKVAIVPTTGGPPKALPDLKGNIQALVFSNKGDRLATVEEKGKVRVWDPSSGALVTELPDSLSEEVWQVAFSDDSKLLAATGAGATLWDVDKKKKICATEERWMFTLAFTRDQGSLVTSGNGMSARWDTATCKEKAAGMASTGGTFGSWVSPDGKYVAASEPDGHGLSLYDTRGFQSIDVLAKSFGCKDHIGPVRFSRDGEILLATGTNQWFKSFRADSRKVIASYDVPKGDEVNQLVMFDDGERLLVVRQDKGELVSAVSKAIAYTIDLKGSFTFDVSWDMKYILGAGGGEAHVWDAATGKLVRAFSMTH